MVSKRDEVLGHLEGSGFVVSSDRRNLRGGIKRIYLNQGNFIGHEHINQEAVGIAGRCDYKTIDAMLGDQVYQFIAGTFIRWKVGLDEDIIIFIMSNIQDSGKDL